MGTFTKSTGTVTYDRAGVQNVVAVDYYNLYVSGGNTKTSQGSLNVANDLTVTGAGTVFDLGSNNLEVDGDAVVSSSGTITASTASIDFDESINADGGNITFTGSGTLNLDKFVTNLGTFTAGNSTTVFSYGGTQVLPGNTYYNLTVSGGGKTVGGNVNVSNNLTVDGASANFNVNANDLVVNGATSITNSGTINLTTGTFDADGEINNSAGSLNISSSGNLILSNTVTDLGTVNFGSSSTVTYDEADAQTVDNVDYHHLVISGGATKTLSNATNVGGDLTVSGSGTILDVNTRTLDVNGTSTISSNGKVTISSGTYDVDGTMNCTASLEFTGGGNLNLSNTVTDLGTFTKSTSTVTYDEADAQTVDNVDYHHLVISGGATKTLSNNTNVGGDLTVSGTGTILDVNTRTLDVNGTSTISSNGKVTISTGRYEADGTMNCTASLEFTDGGNLNLSNTVTDLGTFTKSTSTVTYDEADAQTVDNVDYHHLVISGGATKTLSNNTNVGGDLTVSGTGTILDVNTRTLDVNGTSTISSNGKVTISSGTYDVDGTMNCTASLEFTGGGNLNLSNTVTDLGTFTKSTSTVTYDEADAQTVDNVNYHHLVIDQNGTKTAGGDLDVDGNLTISNSAVLEMDDANNRVIDLEGDFTILSSGNFTARAGNHNFAGNWDCSGGTFQSTSEGTVTLSGSSKTINTGSGNSFYNLTSSGAKTVQSDLDIDGNLTVSSGELAMGTNNADLASSKTVDCDGTISISSGVFTANGPSDFTNGTLSISSTGTYDANGTFTASSGNVTFTGAGFLKCNNTVSNLGTLTNSAGTVVYDGASTQGIFTDNYYNLTIDQSGTKQASGTLDIDGDLTVSNSAVFDINFNNADVAGNWNDAGGIFQAGDGVVTLSGSGKTITTGGSNYFAGLTINSSGTITAQSELDINGAFDISSGTFDLNGQNADVAGTWDDATGTFQATGGTITLSGSTSIQTGSSNYFYGLTINSSGTTSASTALDINGDFTLSSGTFSPGSNGVEVAGNWSNSATFTPGTGTVTFNGSGAQTISGTNTFYDLTINNSHASSKVSANGSTLSVQDDLLVSDGIFESASDYDNVTISSGATLELSGNITVSGDWSNSGTFTPNTNTVTFDGGVAQSLTSGSSSFYDLSTATASTDLTIQDALVVSNDLTIAASTTLDAGSNQAISVGGDWSNSGTFTSASGTVTFNGSGAQTVTTGGTGTGNDFNNVTITNTAGSPGDAADVETSGAIKVTGTLNVTDGQFMPATSSDFVNVTLSASDGILKPASGSSITVSGTWNNSGGSSGSFDGNSGTVSFDAGGAQSLTSGGISFYNLSTATASTDLTIQDALVVSNDLTISASTTLDAGSNRAISVAGNWSNSGTFTSASGTVTFNGSGAQTVTTGGTGTGNDFNNVTITNTSGSPGDAADVETSEL